MSSQVVPEELSATFRITGFPSEGFEGGYKTELFDFAGSKWFIEWFPKGCPADWPEACEGYASYFLHQDSSNTKQMTCKQTIRVTAGSMVVQKKMSWRDNWAEAALQGRGIGWGKLVSSSRFHGVKDITLALTIHAKEGHWKSRNKRRRTLADIKTLAPDTTLRGQDNVEVKVHRVVLSVHSPVFRNRFEKQIEINKANMNGKKIGRRPSILINDSLDLVVVDGFDGMDLSRMVSFFYDGKIDLGPFDAPTAAQYKNLLRLSVKFETEDLMSAVVGKATEGLDFPTPFAFGLYERLIKLSVECDYYVLYKELLLNATKGISVGNVQARLRSLIENPIDYDSTKKAVKKILSWLSEQESGIVSELGDFLMNVKEMKVAQPEPEEAEITG